MWGSLGTIRNYFVAVLSMALVVGGCATRDPEKIGPYPSDYEQILIRHIEQSFFDPYSMRGVKISTPQAGHLFFQQGWIVCIEANAKNRMGAYVGVAQHAFLINSGSVVNSAKNPPLCKEMFLLPWLEMDSGA